MHGSVLRIASQITAADNAQVDGQYAADRGGARTFAALVAIAALLILIGLAATNQYLARHFRRMIGPALVCAAVITVAVAGSGFALLLHEATQFKVAKQDAFESINALTRARAVSYDANADESRWLLDRTPALQNDFFTKVSQVAEVRRLDGAAAAADREAYYGGLKSAAAHLSLDVGANSVAQVEVAGFLGTELNNITFATEAQGAAATLTDFNSYIQDDAVIRDDANRGDLAGAVEFDIGTQPGKSNYAYYQYDQALTHIIAINEDAFGAAIADGEAGLGVWVWLPYVTGVLVAVLLGAAVYPRLREYR
jgi:hypothetical protein